jgi:hypothetical protein
MKVYIVQVGKFVTEVTTSREEAEKYCEEHGGRFDRPTGHRFIPDTLAERTAHQYKAGRSGRWNRSDYVITELALKGNVHQLVADALNRLASETGTEALSINFSRSDTPIDWNFETAQWEKEA